VTVRVAIADDQPVVVAGFASMVRQTDDLEVVGEASDGAAAVRLADAVRPDVFLMDVRMPVLDGIDATAQITASPRTAGVRVIILTTFDLDEYVYAGLRAGASGFLLKDVAPEELFHAIRVVAAGDALLAPTVTRRLIAEFARSRPPNEPTSGLELLTNRERDVLGEVARGHSNAEIGARLHMSPATAKTHVGRILMKLAARDRAQLVVAAYESGLVTARDRGPEA
jgi:DNA-binding NarL/FixJ family response regulator